MYTFMMDSDNIYKDVEVGERLQFGEVVLEVTHIVGESIRVKSDRDYIFMEKYGKLNERIKSNRVGSSYEPLRNYKSLNFTMKGISIDYVAYPVESASDIPWASLP
jgi:hypothetical protein